MQQDFKEFLDKHFLSGMLPQTTIDMLELAFCSGMDVGFDEAYNEGYDVGYAEGTKEGYEKCSDDVDQYNDY